MTDTTGAHEPAAEFRRFLEWEVARTFRRNSRFTAPPPVAARPWLRTAALVMVALGVGALGGVASGQVQDARLRDALIAARRGEEQIAAMRLEIARASYEDARKKFEVGIVGQATLSAAEAEFRAMEAALRRLALNSEEIRASGLPPRDEIMAPLVGERDFVKERLQLELAIAQQQVTAAERAFADVERRHQFGGVGRVALLEAQSDVARATTGLVLLMHKLELRQQFLGEKLAAAEVDYEMRKRQLLGEAELVQRLHATAQERLAQARQLRSVGGATEIEVTRAELEAMERAVELQQLRRELEALEARRR